MDIQNNKRNIISAGSEDHVGHVALPFNEEQFKDFIVSLLGKPQTITKKFRGTYEINKDNIITIFELLNQRVFQQNDSKLIQFRATIYYDDNSTVTLNGFEHLVHYNETLPLVSKAIHLTWQFLVKFRDKITYEKQEISLSFITENDGQVSFDDDLNFRAYDNFVYLRIQHTARTWGADIEGLLSKHLQTVIVKPSKISDFFQYNHNRVEYAVSGFLFFITLIFSSLKTLSMMKDSNITNNTIIWLHHYGKFIFLLAGTYILSKFTLILLEEFEMYSKPSFVLLTPESNKEKKKTEESYKRNWHKYLLTIITSLALSVAGNYVFAYLSGQ
jgi:hypothetical protein